MILYFSATGNCKYAAQRLAAARRTNTEIAQTLHLSESTVKNHLKRIFDKLGLDGGARGKRVLLASLLPPKDSP